VVEQAVTTTNDDDADDDDVTDTLSACYYTDSMTIRRTPRLHDT